MERFGLSPLIRFTLLSLYLALVLLCRWAQRRCEC